MIKFKYLLALSLVLTLQLVSGQGRGAEVEMADAMRANGKIYVVVAVLGIIFAGIVVYLILIDRKLNRMEKKIDQ